MKERVDGGFTEIQLDYDTNYVKSVFRKTINASNNFSGHVHKCSEEVAHPIEAKFAKINKIRKFTACEKQK